MAGSEQNSKAVRTKSEQGKLSNEDKIQQNATHRIVTGKQITEVEKIISELEDNPNSPFHKLAYVRAVCQLVYIVFVHSHIFAKVCNCFISFFQFLFYILNYFIFYFHVSVRELFILFTCLFGTNLHKNIFFCSLLNLKNMSSKTYTN